MKMNAAWHDTFRTVEQYSDYTSYWSSVYPTYFNTATGSKAVTNKNGQMFALYLMPELLPISSATDGFELYASVCAEAGLKMVISGYSNYFPLYRNVQDCIPLPHSDTNGKIWGSTADVASQMNTLIGWDNFVIHDSNERSQLQAYPNSYSISSPKRAVCGITF